MDRNTKPDDSGMPSWLLWVAGSLLGAVLVLLPVFMLGKGYLFGQEPRFAICLVVLMLWVLCDLAASPSNIDPNKNVKLVHANGDSFTYVSGVLILCGVWLNVCDLAMHGGGSLGPTMPSVGVAIAVAGLWLRYQAIATLGKYFTTKLLICFDQPLVSTGVYRLIRHPSYSGLLLITFGFNFIFETVVGLVYFLLVIVPLVLFRISREEKLLYEGFGDAFLEYKKNSWRLVPFFF